MQPASQVFQALSLEQYQISRQLIRHEDTAIVINGFAKLKPQRGASRLAPSPIFVRSPLLKEHKTAVLMFIIVISTIVYTLEVSLSKLETTHMVYHRLD